MTRQDGSGGQAPGGAARRATRLVMFGLLIGLAAWWAGARWGGPQPVRVGGAVPELAQAPPGKVELTGDEQVNVRVYQQASPAVANIVTRAVEYNFFLGPVPSEGAGSGFLIDEAGHVLTNFHVVAGAQEIEVTLGDQTRYSARLVGGDVRNDVALLKIDARGRKLTPLPLGDSRALRVGQRVLAIGNPFGFQSTLTTGVISALGRTVQTGEQTFIDEAIQTDAAINRGNSGGPLLNSAGQVIGINTAIFTPTGATAGIGFAIPIHTARQIAADLMRDGRVRRAYLGVEGVPLSIIRGLAEALELPVSDGYLVSSVVPNGPAARAGIRGGNRAVRVGLYRLVVGGDVLVAVNGQKIEGPLGLIILLNRHRPGDEITLTVLRGRQQMDVRVTLGEQ